MAQIAQKKIFDPCLKVFWKADNRLNLGSKITSGKCFKFKAFYSMGEKSINKSDDFAELN